MKKSSHTVAEWQDKVQRIQKKVEIKQKRRLSFTETVESPLPHDEQAPDDDNEPLLDDFVPTGVRRRSPHGVREDAGVAGTPSKMRRDNSLVSRRTLIVVMVMEAIVILGLAGGFAWAMWDKMH